MIKKNVKYLIVLAFMMVMLPRIAFALGETCNNLTYNVYKVQSTEIGLSNGEVYELNVYNTTAPGVGDLKTYCLSPGSKGPGSGTTYRCSRVLDPTGVTTGIGSKYHAFDVAATKAYQLLKNTGLSDIPDRQVGEIVFRWLSFRYNGAVTDYRNISTASKNIRYFTPVYGEPNPTYWSIDSEMISIAKDIYRQSRAIGDRVLGSSSPSAYQSVAPEIDSPIYTTKVLENTVTASGRTIKVQIDISNPPEKIYWETLRPRCSKGYTCSLVDNGSTGSGRIVTINVSGASVGGTIAVDFDIYDSNSAVSNIMLLKAANKQDMLVVLDQDNHNAWPGTVEVPIEDAPGTSDFCRIDGGRFIGPNGNPVSEQTFYEQCCDLIDPNTPEFRQYCSCGDPGVDYIGACSEFNTKDDVVVNRVYDTKQDAKLKTCLFRNYSADVGKNKYQMLDQSTVVNNPYCKVSCIEEYEFKLPNAKYTTSGGYFSLSSEVSGKRTCYVNAADNGKYNGIDHDKFIRDLFEASQKLAEAQSTYNKLKGGTDNTDSKANQGCQKNTIWYNKKYSYTGYNVTRNGDSIAVSSESIDVKEGNWTDGSESGTSTDANCIVTPDDDCKTCSNNGVNGSEAGLKSAILGEGNSLESYAATINTYKEKIKEIFKSYDDCIHGWENNFVFDPTIEFEYDEPYQNMGEFNNKFEKVSENVSGSKNYCITVGESYVCNGSADGSAPQSYADCSDGTCRTVYQDVTTTRFMTQAKSSVATYQPKNKFSVYTPIGTIKLNEDTGLYTVLCKEENCLPVSLNATTGVFNFDLKFSNIGQYNDTNANGRLMGGANNVFDALGVDAGYVCQYVNNCPECDYTCVGDHCNLIEDPPCPTCPYVCQNCIFDGKNSSFYYRTVSVNNLFPNERKYGPNWNNEKGTYTKQQIEKEGEDVYKEPEYSYTINANQMKRIREFNQSVGGYLNTQMQNGENALSCYTLSSNGVDYENIYCISSFLNTPGNTYFTENKRNDIWTLWPESGYFTSSTKYSVRDGVGPSWK